MPTINRETVISFPLEPNTPDITTGIEAGSLYLNKVLFDKQLNYGEAHCDRFEVTLFGVGDLSGKTILVYQLDYSNDPDNPTRYDLFYGVVDSCLKEENNTNRRLVAYDLMYTVGNQDATAWWNNYWSSRATSTLGDMLENLLTYGQFVRAFNLNFLNSPTANVEVMQFAGIQSITFGTLLSYICQLLLCNPHFEGLAGGYSLLDFVFIGALYGTTYHRSTHNIDTQYEDENSHFEDYETSTVDRVVLYGETDVIAGSYGTGNNVYVIKNNPLLYNLVNTTYDALAQTIYNNFDGYEAYTPAKVKMVVSDPNIILGDTITTTHGNSTVRSIVSSMEMSGSLFVEQTLISSGSSLLTPDDFNLTNAGIANATNTANDALNQANLTARHFVWVPNDGAYVTTDNTPAGQAPTRNYSKLTEDGLYVAVDGKEVAHFGVDTNDNPVSVLGSNGVGDNSLVLSSTGILAGQQQTTDKIDYFSLNVATDPYRILDYRFTFGQSVNTNNGVCSVVLGDGNTITDDSEAGVFIAGHNNTVDNNRALDNYSGTCVLGRNNTVEGKVSIVAGNGNHIYDTNGYGTNNYIIGAGNTITSSGYGAQYNSIVGRGNTITGDSTESVVLGKNNDVVGSNNCLLGYGLKDGANTLNNIIVGQYNVAPTTDGNFIVGNGTSDNQRSNAMKVDDSGNTTIAGNLYFNGGSSSLSTQLSNKQAKLVSGTNIKTINGTDILGGGNLSTATNFATQTSAQEAPVSIGSDTNWHRIRQILGMTAGKLYLVEVSLMYPSATGGFRSIGISTSATNSSGYPDPSTSMGGNFFENVAPVSGAVTNITLTTFFTPASGETYYLCGRQNSGGSLSVTPRYRIVQLN